MSFTAVRMEIIDKLLNDPEWAARLNKVKTFEEYKRLLVDYTKHCGFTVKEAKL